MMYTIRSARLADASELVHVHIESWRSTYKGIVPADYLAALSYERRVEQWKRTLSKVDPQVFQFVAVDEQEHVVGFVTGGRPQQEDEREYRGELYAIYLLEACQGQGLGRRLVRQFAESMIRAGMDSMFLWVLRDNKARRFYESLGGELIRKQPITIGGAALEEVAYGWKNIKNLVNV